MDEWWTYRPSDFILFSRETYYSLFELYHASVWPAHLVALVAAVATLRLLRDGAPWKGRVIAAMLALQWLWVAGAFHLAHFTSINPFATYFAAVFVVQAVLLATMSALPGSMSLPRGRSARERGALALVSFALLGVPLLGLVLGRGWRQIELVGMTPDATAIATLGLVVLLARRARILLLAIPVTWCLVAGVMLWTLGSAEAAVPPMAAVLALVLIAGRRAVSKPALPAILLVLLSAPLLAQGSSPPALVLGEFVDDYGGRHTVSHEQWVQHPANRYRIVRWSPEGQYLIAQNDSSNRGAPRRWTRIDWMPLPGMPPYEWAFCFSAYDAATAAVAESSAVARRSTPRTGCNGFPFTRMRRP